MPLTTLSPITGKNITTDNSNAIILLDLYCLVSILQDLPCVGKEREFMEVFEGAKGILMIGRHTI